MEEASKQPRWHFALGLILLIAIALRALAFSLFEIVHPDELMQYQEQAFRLVHGHGLAPWEARYGIRSPLIPMLLAGPMALGGLISPGEWLPLGLAHGVYTALCLMIVPAAWWIGAARSRWHGVVAALIAAVWFESVMFGVQVLSESLAAAFACGGTAALLHRDRKRALLLAGFLLAFAVLLRMQYGMCAALLVPMILRTDGKAWCSLALGALPALALSAAADLAAGLVPFSWAVKNLSQNIGENRAAFFGTSDHWQYLRYLFARLQPAALIILVAALFAPRQYRPVLIAAVATILAHSLIGHKEYRFIWLPVLLIVLLAGIASAEIALRLARRRGESDARSGAAIVFTCALWAMLSFASYRATGGMGVFRGGAYMTSLGQMAARIPSTCGIAVPTADRDHVTHAFLPRRVELYLFSPEQNEGAKPFDPRLLDAANALIVTGTAAAPAQFGVLACRTGNARDGGKRACLYWRPGPCLNVEAARGLTFQEVMIANDM